MSAYQFQAIWRLTPDGLWRAIHDEADARVMALATVGELMATMCAQRLERGAEVTARFGQDMLLARVDDQGVLVGLHHARANPLMVRTAMSRMEQTSTRGLGSPSARSHAPYGAQPQAPPDRSTRLAHASPPTFAQDHAQAHAQAHAQDHRRDEARFAVAPDFDTINLQEFLDEESELDPRDPSAQPSAACSWQQVADFIALTIERAQDYIGRTVASNYWREALGRTTTPARRLRVDVRGQALVIEGDPHDPVHHSADLELAWEHWQTRCRRVVPALDQLLDAIGRVPWIIPTMEPRR